MKTGLVYALAIIALVHGKDGIYGRTNRETKLRDGNSYKHLLRIGSIAKPQICTPGTTMQDDCKNTCKCFEDGSGWECTRIGCAEQGLSSIANSLNVKTMRSGQANPSQRAKRELYDRDTCVPNAHFKDDCNWCICGPDGRRAICTLMGCGPKKFP